MQVEGHLIEILAIERARSADPGTEGHPLCLFTFRPKGNLGNWVLMLTSDQCVRFRDTLDDFLNDQESWLFLSEAQQQEMREQSCN